MNKSIDKFEFKEKLDSGEYILVDIRAPDETSNGKITPDALERDFYDKNFKLMINALKRDKKYLIYCRSGGRSKVALQMMDEMDFGDVYELNEGIVEWGFD
jgi:rhodanese-related sulfurtransferase